MLARYPRAWSDQLTERLREIADLAEVYPVSRARQGPVSMRTRVEGLHVQYEVDRDKRQLLVVDLAVDRSEDQNPGGESQSA
jgi:hypothetical protein